LRSDEPKYYRIDYVYGVDTGRTLPIRVRRDVWNQPSKLLERSIAIRSRNTRVSTSIAPPAAMAARCALTVLHGLSR
jgi:hypothetical protein